MAGKGGCGSSFAAGGAAAEPQHDVETFPLCVLNPDGSVVQRIRAEVVYDAAGTATTIRYVDAVDGSPVALPGGTTIGVCPGASGECRNTASMLLCDAPTDSLVTISPAIADSNVAAVGQTQFQDHPGPYAPLWSGGTLIYPAGPGPVQEHLAAVGRLTADMSGCEGAAGTLTISVRVRNDGPDDGQAWDGGLRLFRGTTMIAAHDALTWAPVGWQGTLTVSAPVTPAEIAAGDIRVALILETYHLGAKQWTADQFNASLQLEGCEAAASLQFLRNVVVDCETGEVIATHDTTLDGDPYTVVGTVEQCEPVAAPEECCETGTTLVLCDVDGTGTATPFLRRLTYTPGNATPGVTSFEIDGVTPYEPQGTVGVCPGTAATADGPVEILVECRCDDVAGDGSVIFRFVELIAVAADGTLTSLGYWTEDLTSPYDPVSMIPCPGGGADPVVTVQAHRVELAAGGTWDAAAWPTLQSVTAVAHGGTGTVTTGDGASTLFEGESVTWSVARDVDSRLVGPLTVEAVTGVVTVAWTTT